MIDEPRQKIAWGISVGSMYWSACGSLLSDNESPQEIYRRGTSTPASVLLGCAPGEPLRFDCWVPPHPRGTASDWPPEAIVNGERGSGRFPLAAAWTGRHYELPWRWKPDSEFRQLDSLDAICFGVAQLAMLQAHKSPSTIVIPNDFRQREQQKLLDACSALGVSTSLVWLPVAAALAWLEDHRGTLPIVSTQSDRRLIVHVVHADWGRVRCSSLNLVVHTDEFGCRWMPARRRPSVSDWECPGFGWTSVGGCDSKDASAVWRSLFGYGDSKPPVRANQDSTLLQQIARWSISQSSPLEVDKELAAHVSNSPAAITIFVGDFAMQLSSGPKVAKYCDGKSLVFDGRNGEDFLAYGASIFATNQRKGRTSYLDTLPNLELFVDRSTHYDWLRLLGDEDHFVSGGEEWKLLEPIEGLAVPRGSSGIKLVVSHEEEPGVRELNVLLDHPAEVDLAAKLTVSAIPAQGNAKLTLRTEALGTVQSRSIVANWKRMSPLFGIDGKTPMTKDDFAATRPRAFPNLRPRPADPDKWFEFFRHAVRLSNASTLSNVSPALLGSLLESAKITGGRSAISSEGSPPKTSDQALVDSLANFLLECLKKQGDVGEATVDYRLIKILGFMSPSIDGLDEWISGRIGSTGNIDETTCLIAGNCIRTPEVASQFVTRLLSHIPRSNSKRLLSYQMQALGRLLSQRQNVMSKIPEHLVYKLVEECLRVFENELARNNLWWLFEHSGLVVVYALRYRINNSSFMEPKSELAVRAKEKFELAREKIEIRLNQKHSSFGYSSYERSRLLRLKSALQQLIDYIDKRGEGDILLLLDD